jgi:WD40 repeat protein
VARGCYHSLSVTAIVRSLLRRLTGPLIRRLIVVTLVAGLWVDSVYLPPRPLIGWTRPSPFVRRVVLSEDGMQVVTLEGQLQSDERRSSHVRDAATGQVLRAIDFGSNWRGPDVEMSADGTWLAGDDEDGAFTAWHTATGRNLRLPPVLGAAPSIEWSQTFAVSKDGRALARVAKFAPESEVHLWDVTANRRYAILNGAQAPLAFSADGRLLVTGHEYGQRGAPCLKAWDVATGKELRALPGPDLVGGLAAVAVSLDCTRVAAISLPTVEKGDSKAKLAIWDLSTGRCVSWQRIRAGFDQPLHLEYDPSGRILAAQATGLVGFWQVTTEPPRCVSRVVSDVSYDARDMASVELVKFSRDRTRFVAVTLSDIHAAIIYDATTLSQVMRCPAEWMNKLAFDPILSTDGRRAAITTVEDRGGTATVIEKWLTWLLERVGLRDDRVPVRVYDLATNPRTTGLALTGEPFAFGPDGKTIWTYEVNGNLADSANMWLTVRQWAIPTGRPPAWLLAVTAFGVLMVVADWHRSRRRLGLPAAAAVGYPAEQGGPTP